MSFAAINPDDALTAAEAELEEAKARRDAGAKVAELSVHTSWRLAAEATIVRLARSGVEFTSDDIHEAVGDPPAHHNAIGGLFIAASRRREIEAVGYRQSTRPVANARPVRLWRGTGKDSVSSNAPRQGVPTEDPGSGDTSPETPRQPGRSQVDQSQTRRRGLRTATWTTAETAAPCVRCGRPAFLRLDGQPRHRLDCLRGEV